MEFYLYTIEKKIRIYKTIFSKDTEICNFTKGRKKLH